jgi:putative transposase
MKTELSINMLLDWVTPDGSQRTERVLWINSVSQQIVLIDIFDGAAMPYEIPMSELAEADEQADFRVLKVDPYEVTLSPADIPEKYRRRMEKAWSLIRPVVELPNAGAFDSERRFQAISKVCHECKVHKIAVYRYLRRFWKRGQKKIGLLPDYKNSGAPGRERVPGTAKRGRPNKLTKQDGVPRGINIGPDDKRHLLLGMKLFFEDSKASNNRSMRKAHQLLNEKYYSSGFTIKNGVHTPVQRSVHETPTYGQTRYWYDRLKNSKSSQIARNGVKRFNLRHRGLGGDAAAGAFGPGSVYQIDSTPANIHLVSSIDPTRRIGRPVLYFVVDVFSRLIAGFSVSLEEESYVSAMAALGNALTDKVDYCAQFGIAIAPEEWPSHHIPESLVADRGELISKNADHLAGTLGICISNAPAHRADLKPFVERSFRTAQDEVIHHLPGAINQRRERGDKDERLDAILTLEDFRKIVIQHVLCFNRSRIEGFRPQQFMLSDEIEPRPMDLWKWGILNRSGHLRFSNGEQTRINLLPRSEATVTDRGIRFRKVFYTSDTEQKEDWRVQARANHSWKIDVAFDPMNTDSLFIVTDRGFEPCRILEASSLFAHRCWDEVEDYSKRMNQLKDRSATRERQSRTDRDAQIQATTENALQRLDGIEKPTSKAEALRDIRENRRVERDRERFAAKGPSENPQIPLQDTALLEHPVPAPDGSEYVSQPADFGRLRKQRELHRNE